MSKLKSIYIILLKGINKMQKLNLIFTLIIFIFIQTFNQVFAEDSQIKEIEQIENARIKAMINGNYSVLDKILSEDLIYIHSHGKLETKTEFLNVLKSGKLKYKAIERGDLQIRPYDNVAVINGKAKLTVEYEGKEIIIPIRFTAVYKKSGGNWEMVNWQSTALSSP